MNVVRISGSTAPRSGRRPRGWLARHRARRDADAWLRASGGRADNHPAFAWRVAELVAPRERLILARSLAAVASDVSQPRPGINISPLNRRGLAPHVDDIEQLGRRLADLGQPVTAASILLVRDLLTDGSGPFYAQCLSSELSETFSLIHATLEAN
jgi:hypothetical protein